MLVLKRKLGERILIGDDIVVTVVGRDGNWVKIGVDAPPDVRVDREEVARMKEKRR